MKVSRVPIELIVGALALALTGAVCATFASCAPGALGLPLAHEEDPAAVADRSLGRSQVDGVD